MYPIAILRLSTTNSINLNVYTIEDKLEANLINFKHCLFNVFVSV